MKTIRAKWPKSWAKLEITSGLHRDLVSIYTLCRGDSQRDPEAILSTYTQTGKMPFEDFIRFADGRLSSQEDLSQMLRSGYISKWEVEVFEHIRNHMPSSWRVYSQAKFIGCSFHSDLLVVTSDARMFVVELDGAQHEERKKKDRDITYDRRLLEIGIPVIRIGYGYFIDERSAALVRLLTYFTKLSLKTSVRSRSQSTSTGLPAAVATYIYFQTTGLKKTAVPVDICVRTLRDGKISNEVYSLVNCGVSIDAGATRCHGITNSQLQGAPSLKEILNSSDVAESLLASQRIFVFDLSYFGEIISRSGGLANSVSTKIFGVKELAKKRFELKKKATIQEIASACDIRCSDFTRFDSQSYCSLLIEMVNHLPH